MGRELGAGELAEIKKRAREKLGECRKSNDIIGTQIFSILGIYARVVYYPLGEEAPWGFTRLSGVKDDSGLAKPFVAINTSIPVDCQVFAAAHELYHIWYEEGPALLPADLLQREAVDLEERLANRFAAEFLLDELLVRQELDLHGIDKLDVRGVLKLADIFMVPYQAMAKRLQEVGLLREGELAALTALPPEAVKKYRKRYGLATFEPDHRIVVDNLVELAAKAYEGQLLSYEKLEYLLDLCGLVPAELGIEEPAKAPFPSDEELARAVEEEA